MAVLELERAEIFLSAGQQTRVSQLPGMSRSSAPLRQHRSRERGGEALVTFHLPGKPLNIEVAGTGLCFDSQSCLVQSRIIIPIRPTR